jgi:hypothetical protein
LQQFRNSGNSSSSKGVLSSIGLVGDTQQQQSSAASTHLPATATTSVRSVSNTPPNQSDNDNKFDDIITSPEEYLKLIADKLASDPNNADHDPIKLIAAQQNKLGLLFQTKALEDKVRRHTS